MKVATPKKATPAKKGTHITFATPKVATPKVATCTPKVATPKVATTKKATPKKATPVKEPTPKKATPVKVVEVVQEPRAKSQAPRARSQEQERFCIDHRELHVPIFVPSHRLLDWGDCHWHQPKVA